MKSRAIVTLATNRYLELWENRCSSNWAHWANNHNYDLIIYKGPIDSSSRALSRSHAWQKLLVMAEPSLLKYETCLWLDSDILINPDSPDPYVNLDPNKIAVTHETGSNFSGDCKLLKRSWSWTQEELASRKGISTPVGYFEGWGLNSKERPLFNTGTIGFTPKYHQKFLKDIYNNWEEGGIQTLWGEMIPFNIALQATTWQVMPNRYNQLVFPFTNATRFATPHQIGKVIDPTLNCHSTEQLVIELYKKSFFLHFAGCFDLMYEISPKLLSL